MKDSEKVGKRRAKDRDGVYKRRGRWHFDFKDPLTNQWRSKSTGKASYNEAKEFKRLFLESLKGQYNPSNDRMKFVDAADAYITHRGVSAAAGTLRLEKERLRPMKKLLAKIGGKDLKLRDIDIRLVRNYQQKRIAEGVGPRTVNMEGQLLRSILKHQDQWKLDGKYKSLPEPASEVGRALTTEEEVRLIDAAASRPEWFVAYHATVLENETGMRGVEVRNLQIRRVDLDNREIRLQKSKTKGGIRTIPLSVDALTSVSQLLERARRLGADKPDDYLIPALVTVDLKLNSGTTRRVRQYDPGRPTQGWRSAWRSLTKKAGLKGLRAHDLRHNWITSHAEIGTPQSVLEAQSGHLSKRMSDHYKHISEGAARKAAEELWLIKAEQRAAARAKLYGESDAQRDAAEEAKTVIDPETEKVLRRDETAVKTQVSAMPGAGKAASVRSSVHPVSQILNETASC